MDIVSLAISLVSGAVGGNVAGAVLKKFSLGTAGNSLVGILGGGIGSQVLGMIGLGTGAAAGADVAGAAGSNIVHNLVSGVAGGGILMAVIGVIRNALNR